MTDFQHFNLKGHIVTMVEVRCCLLQLYNGSLLQRSLENFKPLGFVGLLPLCLKYSVLLFVIQIIIFILSLVWRTEYIYTKC